MSDSSLTDDELATRRKLRNFMLALGLAAIIAVVVAVLLWPRGEPSPVIALEDVASIEFDFQATSAGQTGLRGGADNPDYYTELIEVLSNGLSTSEHKCADTGRIIIKLRDGRDLQYGTLSGHDEKFYEFRAYTDRDFKIYRVPRAAMASALLKLKIERIDEPRPEL